MNAHSESKRAFLLLLGLAECVAPTQEWPLAQCLFPTDRQPWDDSKSEWDRGPPQNPQRVLARFKFKIIGVLTRCARAHAAGETCRNPTWPDLIHSSAVRSDGRRALSLSHSALRRSYKTYTEVFLRRDGPIDGCTQLPTALSPVFVTLPNIPKRPSHSRTFRRFDPPKRPKWLQSKHLLCCSLISRSPSECPCSQAEVYPERKYMNENTQSKIHEKGEASRFY